MKISNVSLLCGLAISAVALAACGGGGSAPAVDVTASPSDVETLFESAPVPSIERRSGLEFPSTTDSEKTTTTQTAVPAVVYSAEAGASLETPLTQLEAETASTTDTFNVHVSPDGSDDWSGLLANANAARSDGPVKTIAAAQVIVRRQLWQMKAGAASRVPINVLIAAGEYRLSAPLVFTPADSGVVDAPVVYSAVVPGTAMISGGVELVQQTSAGGDIAVFASPAEGGNQAAGGGQLYIDGKRATLARQPNAGSYWFVKKQVALPSEPANSQGAEAFGMFLNAQSWVSGLNQADRGRAIIHVMHSWTSARGRFSDAEMPADTLAIQPRSRWPYLKFGTSQRYYFENVLAAFDAPGEWLWDASGVRYIPIPGEDAQTVTAIMPILERLVVVNGDIAANQLVENLQFRGLRFAHTRSLVPAEGLNDTQAAAKVSAAIEVDGARAITIDDCTIEQTGGYGVWFRRAVRDSKIINSTLTDLGAGGIRLGQLNQSTTDSVQTGNNAALSNRVSETGKVFPGAVGIWVGQSFDNVVSNNAVFNTTYSAISVGWTWGYRTATSGRNMISNNLIYSVGQGVFDDMAGIYTLGISQGTVIRGNVIREVRGYPEYGVGSWGIYNDAGTSGVLVEGNVVVGTDNGGYHLNYGSMNILRDNVFAHGKRSEFVVTRSDPEKTKLSVTDNVFIPMFAKPFVSFAQAPHTIFTDNAVSPLHIAGELDISKCGAGCSLQSFDVTTTSAPRGITMVGTTPAFADRVAATVAAAGPAEPPTVTASPDEEPADVVVEEPVIVPPPPLPEAPPMSFDTNFAAATLGTQPIGLRYFPKGDLSVMKLVSNSGAPGGRCLQFIDSAAMPATYYPFIFASMNHDEGTTVAEFGIRIDANSDFFHEWRDDARPYLVGPSLRISSQGVVVGGQVVAPADVGEWLNVKIIAPLATQDGTWTLEIRHADGEITTVKDLPFRKPGWNKLAWLGFVSNASTNSTMCLSNVTATSSVQ